MKKPRMARIQPSEAELLKSVEYVVYEYANLVSATAARQVDPPINTHLQDAFLLSCRKMADFFLWEPTPRSPEPQKYDIVASDFTVSPLAYSLPLWTRVWGTAMDRQLAHLTWKRDQGWNGSANKPLMEELQTAWKLFLSKLQPKYQARFREEINKKRHCSGFEKLDLG